MFEKFVLAQFSHSVMSGSLRCNGLRHVRPRCSLAMPTVYPNSYPLSWWCRPTISSSIVPFSSCLQSFPASGSFLKEAVIRQRTGASVLASVLPLNIQDWFSLGLTSWISFKFKGFSRVFYNTTVQKHQFFGAQLSSQSNSHVHTWPWKNHSLD